VLGGALGGALGGVLGVDSVQFSEFDLLLNFAPLMSSAMTSSTPPLVMLNEVVTLSVIGRVWSPAVRPLVSIVPWFAVMSTPAGDSCAPPFGVR
jgi:hypothetical protein